MPHTQQKTISSRMVFEKIVVNAGVGRASQLPNFEDKILPQITRDFSAIVGQRPQVRRAKKSISGFKVREGQIVGVSATLRGQRMVDFFERIITIVLPRVHDFRGVALTSIDHGGALNIGFKEQTVFPEINPEESSFVFSLGVTVVPKSRNQEQATEIYRSLRFPLTK